MQAAECGRKKYALFTRRSESIYVRVCVCMHARTCNWRRIRCRALNHLLFIDCRSEQKMWINRIIELDITHYARTIKMAVLNAYYCAVFAARSRTCFILLIIIIVIDFLVYSERNIYSIPNCVEIFCANVSIEKIDVIEMNWFEPCIDWWFRHSNSRCGECKLYSVCH